MRRKFVLIITMFAFSQLTCYENISDPAIKLIGTAWMASKSSTEGLRVGVLRHTGEADRD